MDINKDVKIELERVTHLSDSSPKFGALIVSDGEVISSGYAEKLVKEGHLVDEPLLLMHAEESALMQALKKNIDISGADVYVLGLRDNGEVRLADYSYSCVVCSRLLKQSGIQNVIYPTARDWKKVTVEDMFSQALQRVEADRA